MGYTAEEEEMMAPMHQAFADAAEAAKYVGSVENLTHQLARMQNHHDADRNLDAEAVLVAKIADKAAGDKAAYEATILTEWTRELTIARRAEMNAAVQSPLLKQIKLLGIERKLGYTHNNLKTAIALHNL